MVGEPGEMRDWQHAMDVWTRSPASYEEAPRSDSASSRDL